MSYGHVRRKRVKRYWKKVPNIRKKSRHNLKIVGFVAVATPISSAIMYQRNVNGE